MVPSATEKALASIEAAGRDFHSSNLDNNTSSFFTTFTSSSCCCCCCCWSSPSPAAWGLVAGLVGLLRPWRAHDTDPRAAITCRARMLLMGTVTITIPSSSSFWYSSGAPPVSF